MAIGFGSFYVETVLGCTENCQNYIVQWMDGMSHSDRSQATWRQNTSDHSHLARDDFHFCTKIKNCLASKWEKSLPIRTKH